MAYRRGGDRGDQHQPPYSGRVAGARGVGRAPAPTGFVWSPPGPTPRPAPPVHYQPATVIYHNRPATAPHQGAYQHGVVFRVPPPAYPYAPAPVTIRGPSPPPSPTAAPFQPAHVSSGPRAPAPAPPSPAPSTAAIAKELEQKLFVSETALAPPAAAAAAAVAASQQGSAAASEASPDVDLAPVSKKGLVHPARPGPGTVGKKVRIRANHFLVNVADNNLFHYDVAINPESKSRATNRELPSELIKLPGNTSLGGKLAAYDGRKSLYTAGSLPFDSKEFVITLVDLEKKDKQRAEREYKITIRIAGRTDLYHLQQFLCGTQRDMPQGTIQVLDVVVRESPSWNYVTVPRSIFSTMFGHRGDIGEGLECRRGYYQSLRPTQMGLSLNIDISATSFFKPVTLIQFVQEFLCLRDASRPLSDWDHVKIKKVLGGVRVETNHQQDQIRRYKITGITPIPMSQLIFPVDDRGTRMTVVQYFMERYSYKLLHTSWPCLQSGSDSCPVYLPMEVCKIEEGQRYSKKLNDKQVTNILRATCQRPQQREQSIREDTIFFLPIRVVLFIVFMLAFLPLAAAQPVGLMPQTHGCNHTVLAKQITGFCLSMDPLGFCCNAVLRAVDSGEENRCICDVLKDGVSVDVILQNYRFCGGREVQIAQVIEACTLPKMIQDTPGVPMFVWLLVALGFVLLGLIIWVVVELKREFKCQSPPAISLVTVQARSPPRRRTADDVIRSQRHDLSHCDSAPFVGALTRGRLHSLGLTEE